MHQISTKIICGLLQATISEIGYAVRRVASIVSDLMT